MTTKFYIVRHGESTGNLTDTFIGWGNSALTEKGEAQAECTAEFLADVHFTAAYASDLRRAYRTAEIIASRHPGLKVTAKESLREMGAGEWEGRAFKELRANCPNFNLWEKDFVAADPPGGEGALDLYKRVSRAFDEILAENEGGTVLLVSHATPIRVIRVRALGLPPERWSEVDWVSNASVTVISVTDGKFTTELAGADEHIGSLRTCLALKD